MRIKRFDRGGKVPKYLSYSFSNLFGLRETLRLDFVRGFSCVRQRWTSNKHNRMPKMENHKWLCRRASKTAMACATKRDGAKRGKSNASTCQLCQNQNWPWSGFSFAIIFIFAMVCAQRSRIKRAQCILNCYIYCRSHGALGEFYL